MFLPHGELKAQEKRALGWRGGVNSSFGAEDGVDIDLEYGT